MKELEILNDIEIEIKSINESIKFQKGIDKIYAELFNLHGGDRIPKLETKITNLENRRRRIIRKLFNQYCKNK